MTKPQQLVFAFAAGDPLISQTTRDQITREVVCALERRLAENAEAICERVLTKHLQRTVAAVFEDQSVRMLAGQRQLLRDAIDAMDTLSQRIHEYREDLDDADWWKQSNDDDREDA